MSLSRQRGGTAQRAVGAAAKCAVTHDRDVQARGVQAVVLRRATWVCIMMDAHRCRNTGQEARNATPIEIGTWTRIRFHERMAVHIARRAMAALRGASTAFTPVAP